ncbi:serine/threonine-protein kinase ppk23 [Phtheirospermum japonicum]|uniref:Serine/threonine-protein kinase ppk23 n=1 Tax=Phtheirospermum japonicum TaxID=374723 RepID=A0A830B893_9LAMI|nr:serine/threonine-protein kinase ppk23 [Phtheirospermum japonicum]
MARRYQSLASIPYSTQQRPLVTLWYRAPELLLGRNRHVVRGMHHGRAFVEKAPVRWEHHDGDRSAGKDIQYSRNSERPGTTPTSGSLLRKLSTIHGFVRFHCPRIRSLCPLFLHSIQGKGDKEQRRVYVSAACHSLRQYGGHDQFLLCTFPPTGIFLKPPSPRRVNSQKETPFRFVRQCFLAGSIHCAAGKTPNRAGIHRGDAVNKATAVSGEKLLRSIMSDNKIELYATYIIDGKDLLNERTNTELRYLKKACLPNELL